MVMRIDGDPIAAAPAIRKALSAIDPTQSFYAIETMEQALAESIAPRRFNLLLLGTFAIVALVLAVLGVYSVVAYAVAERTQEIGIRLALGAERARVVRMIVAQGMASVIAGIVVGLVAALIGDAADCRPAVWRRGDRRADIRAVDHHAHRDRLHRLLRPGAEGRGGGPGDCVAG